MNTKHIPHPLPEDHNRPWTGCEMIFKIGIHKDHDLANGRMHRLFELLKATAAMHIHEIDGLSMPQSGFEMKR